MDKMIGGEFEKGLADLKALAEKPCRASANERAWELRIN
jgi:hypothetical protein